MSGEKSNYGDAEQNVKVLTPFRSGTDTPGTSGMPGMGGAAQILSKKKESRFQYMMKKYIEKKRKLMTVDITTVEQSGWLWKVIYDGLTADHLKVHGIEDVSPLSFIEYLFDDSWI